MAMTCALQPLHSEHDGGQQRQLGSGLEATSEPPVNGAHELCRFMEVSVPTASEEVIVRGYTPGSGGVAILEQMRPSTV